MLGILTRLKEPGFFFLVTAAFFGVIFVILIPPMLAYDEQDHFFRAYQLSNLNIRAPIVREGGGSLKLPGGYLPSNVEDFGNGFLYSIRLDKNDTSQQKIALIKRDTRLYGLKSPNNHNKNPVVFAGSSVYSPVSYLPQIIGIWIGRLLHLPIIGFYYLGRFFALAAYAFLIYQAIKLSPLGKWLMAVAALTPLSLTMAGSFSADSMTIALAYLTVGLFLNYAFAKKTIAASDIILAAVVSAAVALCKSGLWPLALLFWLVPVSKFASTKRHVLGNLLITATSTISFALWYLLVRYAVPYVSMPLKVAANSSTQLHYVVHSPFGFIAIMLRQYLEMHNLFNYFKAAFGMLGWGEVSVGALGYILIALILLAALVFTLCEKIPEKSISKNSRFGSLAIFLILVGVMSASLYLTLTTVGSPLINGVQGRYILPFLPLAVPVLAGLGYRKNKWNYLRNYSWTLTIPTLMILCITVYSVIIRYY